MMNDNYYMAVAGAKAQGGGKTYVGQWFMTGNANDSSGNSQNLNVTNATLTTGQSGDANTAYLFDKNNFSYLSRVNTDDDILSFTNADNTADLAFEITFLVYVNSWTDNQYRNPHFVSKMNNDAGFYEYGVYQYLNNIYFKIGTSTTAYKSVYIPRTAIPLETWTKVTCRYNGDKTNVVLSMSINDVPQNVTYANAGTYNGMRRNYGQFRIGTSLQDLYAPFFDGKIDYLEMAILNE